MSQFVETIRSYIDAGGHVMLPLIGATLVLWYLIGLRFQALRRGSMMSLRKLIANPSERRATGSGIIDRAARRAAYAVSQYPKQSAAVLDDVLFPFYQQLKRGRKPIMAIVVIAPLVGLLGTVSGMIETFDSLADMSLFSQSGGIAGGISQALFSTQMGLCVAVPGVIVGRLLDRRQQQFEDELDQLKALLGGQA